MTSTAQPGSAGGAGERETIAEIEAILREHVHIIVGMQGGREYAAGVGGMQQAALEIAALRSKDREREREDGARWMREAAVEAVCDVRHRAAANFTPAYSGAQGYARCESLGHAAKAVAALPLQPTPKGDGTDA